MTDVFISYAHEDQAFVRRMVTALEAEGLSVWWDHTIPPGKSWDTFIAKGIAEARCCIVVWSPRSVESDWVKEEATLAKDANKLLPATIERAEPPVGFRRMQAANLEGWNGNANHAQWQLLVREARDLVGKPATASPRPSPRRASTSTPPWPMIAAVAATVVVLVGGYMFLGRTPAATPEIDAYDMADAAAEQTTAGELESVAEPAGAAVDNAAELERLRRERDEALQRASRAEQPASPQPAAAGARPSWHSMVGEWRLVSGSCGMRYNRFQIEAGVLRWDAGFGDQTEFQRWDTGISRVLDDDTVLLGQVTFQISGDRIFSSETNGPSCTYVRR